MAREARYGEWSLRRLAAELRGRHFDAHPPQVEVRADIRATVEFRRHNLVREAAPGTGFDLVLCRNVLIYFNPPTAALVVEKLAVSLAPGGLLVLGPGGGARWPRNSDLERVEHEGATIFRARGAKPLAVRPARRAGPSTTAPLPAARARRPTAGGRGAGDGVEAEGRAAAYRFCPPWSPPPRRPRRRRRLPGRPLPRCPWRRLATQRCGAISPPPRSWPAPPPFAS